MNVEVIADIACETGECPVWHPFEKRLYWTDIPAGKLYRYDPRADEWECCYRGRPVGGFTVQEDGSLVLFRDRGNVVVWHDGAVVRALVEDVADLRATRFNDVCADPAGGVFCGTMSGDTVDGRLYRLGPNGAFDVILTHQGTPNGMGWSPELDTFYYNDSRQAKTWCFAYDRGSEALGSQRLFRDAAESEDPGRPDGLTVDSDGYVWTARWEGGSVLRCARDGAVDACLPVPDAVFVSSLTFAPRYDTASDSWSADMQDVYVTSASRGDRGISGAKGGALFRMRLSQTSCRGKPDFLSRL